MPYVQNALGFTIETIFGLFLIAAILRFLFELPGVDSRNPIAQTVFVATNYPLKILRPFIPGLYGINLASVLLIIIISFLKYGLLIIVSGYPFHFTGVLVIGIGEAINTTTWIFLIAIIVQAILSWVAPSSYHPIIAALRGLSEPVLSLFRRFLPNLQGLDLSPILAILAINLIQNLVAYPIIDFGKALMMNSL
ncbi:MAG: YggT family protein [Gammaproteobacteria bacterium]|nr:YggT family protein [Gammaproteobacteria bacterium]